MKKLTKKAFVALFALFLAVVALGTTTFAWFTLGNVVSVEKIELNVTGGEGIEFAYVKNDGSEELLSNYVSNMTAEQFLGYLAEDYGADGVDDFKSKFKFDLVTSENGKEFKKMEVDRTVSPGVPSLGEVVDATDIETGVLEFKLKFRTKAVLEEGETAINLVWNHLTLTSDPVEWTPSREFVNSQGDNVGTNTSDSYYASDAARVSITGNTGTVVYENASSGTNTVMNDTIIFDKGAHNYYNEVAGIDLEETFGPEGAHPHTPVTTIAGSPTDQIVGTFEGDPSDEYRYSTITVRVYLDGFDAEAFNSILDSVMKIAFKFTFKKQQ